MNEGEELDVIEDKTPQLNEHMQVALKLCYNLKEISLKQDVRKFFFSRFKRALIKKNLIEKVQEKTERYIRKTEYQIRAQTSCLFMLGYKL